VCDDFTLTKLTFIQLHHLYEPITDTMCTRSCYYQLLSYIHHKHLHHLPFCTLLRVTVVTLNNVSDYWINRSYRTVG